MNKIKTGFRNFTEILFVIASFLLIMIPVVNQGLLASNPSETTEIISLLEDQNNDGRPDRLGERVTISGRATVDSGVYSDSYFIIYVQDKTAGIMVFSDSVSRSVKRGDSLRVTGTLALHSSKPEIVVENLKVVEENGSEPDPIPLNRAFNDPESYRGMLVSGEAIAGRSDYGKNRRMMKITPLNGSKDSLYIFVSRANANYEDFKFDMTDSGERIHIKGVLIRYISGYTGNVLYQVIPRNSKDFSVSGIRPILGDRSYMYASIDTTEEHVYVMLESGLWKYDLTNGNWHFEDAISDFNGSFGEYEFGFNQRTGNIEFWSRGVGEFYTLDPKTYKVERLDRSFNHRNQYSHYPFYRNDTLYAFGGYGFWHWNNIMVFFNRALNEWTIQDVKTDSPFPTQSEPIGGVYQSGTDRLFVLQESGRGSAHPENETDVTCETCTIWKFTFDAERWEKMATLELPNGEVAGQKLPSMVSGINRQSSSFSLAEEKMWFIPVVKTDNGGQKFYLRPVDLLSNEVKSAFSLNYGPSNEFTPVNYLYNPQSQEAVIVGVDNLAGDHKFPVRIVRIPKDSLMSNVAADAPFYSSISLYFYLIGITLFGSLLFWFYRYRYAKEENDFDFVPVETLTEANWLNNQEKRLLSFLLKQDHFVDSHEIERELWNDIESYDYRRRLRNDTINSINKKFEKRYPHKGRLIIRKKDPDDNRRYLYGLNEILKEKN